RRGQHGLGLRTAIITTVDSLLTWVRARESRMVRLIRQFVECESPSDDLAAVGQFAELVSDTAASFAAIRSFRGKHITCEMRLPGRKKSGRILALGHLDTVWP